MARKRKGNKINGWINLNKPAGLTSTQALGRVRKALNAQKAGHGGTLDPMATGVLPIALGEATKVVGYAQNRMKIYRFTVAWGEQRETDDAEGEIINTSANRPAPGQIEAVLPAFTGEITQCPPAYSAVKIDGQRAYDLARAGEKPEVKPRQVFIHHIQILNHQAKETAFELTCGKGTYVRSLARDMAEKLDTCGYVKSLERTAVGPFTTDNAISLDKLEEIDINTALEEVLWPLQCMLDDIPALELKEQEAVKLRNGNVLAFISKPDFTRLQAAGFEKGQNQGAVAVLNGRPLAMVEVEGPNVKPVRVFNL